jgi:MFS transporter, ACS family, D-galactonate transporter
MNQTAATGTGVVSARPTWVRWQIVGLLVSYSFMTWFNRVSMSVAYDERIKTQYDITPESMGWVYSAFLFAYMLCMTPGGWLIDRAGPWRALVVMGFGSALFGALTACAGHPVFVSGISVLIVLLVIRSIMGALTAPIYPAASRVVAHWLPPSHRARANGLVQGAAAVGIACTFPVFGRLMDWVDWPTAFVITGAFTALIAIVWTVYGADSPAEHRFVNDAERRYIRGHAAAASADTIELAGPPLWRHPSLILLTVSYACVGYVEYLFFFWMHYYFEDVLHLGKERSRDYAAILTLAMAAGMVAGGWVADWLHARFGGWWSGAVVPVTGMCAGGALLILGVLATETVWIVTLLALALAAVGATEAPFWTLATELGRHRGGTAAAICNTGGNAGGLVAPIVTPWVSGWVSRQFELSAQAGWQWGISLGSVIAVAGAVLWLWIKPRDERSESHG